jgi:hypothetical protein
MGATESRNSAEAAWKALYSWLAVACAGQHLTFTCRQAGDLEFLVQHVDPPRALRRECSEDFTRLRYNTGISGWQELHIVERPGQEAVFETPYHKTYTAEELGKHLLSELSNSPF